MTWRISGPFAAVALVLGLAGPAQASATFHFAKTASNPADLPVSIAMTFDGSGAAVSGDVFGGGFGGLIDFSFRLGTVDIDLADLQALQQACAPPASGPLCTPFALAYAMTPDDGYLRFNNQSYNFAFAYDEGLLSGSFNTDGPGARACVQTGACRYEGQWNPVPAPGAVGLLGLGLAAILAARRRARPVFLPVHQRRASLVNP